MGLSHHCFRPLELLVRFRTQPCRFLTECSAPPGAVGGFPTQPDRGASARPTSHTPPTSRVPAPRPGHVTLLADLELTCSLTGRSRTVCPQPSFRPPPILPLGSPQLSPPPCGLAKLPGGLGSPCCFPSKLW